MLSNMVYNLVYVIDYIEKGTWFQEDAANFSSLNSTCNYLPRYFFILSNNLSGGFFEYEFSKN